MKKKTSTGQAADPNREDNLGIKGVGKRGRGNNARKTRTSKPNIGNPGGKKPD